jgi:hypothetical protein
MVVHHLDVGRPLIRPAKAHTPLIVDPDRILTFSIPLQCLEPICWWRTQVVQAFGGMERFKLTTGNFEYRSRKTLGAPAVENEFRGRALEAPDQGDRPRLTWTAMVSVKDTKVKNWYLL